MPPKLRGAIIRAFVPSSGHLRLSAWAALFTRKRLFVIMQDEVARRKLVLSAVRC
jgi:hypothetical protein